MTLGLAMSGRFSLSLSLLLSLLLLAVLSSDEELSLGLFLQLLIVLSGPLSPSSAAVASDIASRVTAAVSQRDSEAGCTLSWERVSKRVRLGSESSLGG